MKTLFRSCCHSIFQNFPPSDLKCAVVVLAMIMTSLDLHAQSPCWEGSLDYDVSDPFAFCEPVTFTYAIDNTCGSAAQFDVKIEFTESLYEIIDLSELPGAIVNTGIITWITPSVPASEIFEFNIQALVTAQFTVIGNPIHFYVRVKRQSDMTFYSLYANPSVTPLKYVDGPATASQLIQDYWDFLDLTLYPLEDPLNTDVSLACEPEASPELFVSGGIDFDLGTENAPEVYCLLNDQGTSKILMGEGAYLRVKAYTTLIVTDMDISGCQNMWKGIFVEKNAKLVLRNCTIRDAEYAIEAERGATIECFSNTFEDNYVGIYVAPMPLEEVGSPPVFEPEPFEDAETSFVNMQKFFLNTFKGTGSMLAPFEGQSTEPGVLPFAGIWVTDLSSFRVPVIETVENIYNNTFENMANGFVAKRASFIIDRAVFIDINEDAGNDYDIEGYGIHTTGQISGRVFGFGGTEVSHPNFDNCDVAIYSESGSIVVRDNYMQDGDYGIILKRALINRSHILDNFISVTGRGVEVSHGVPLGSGVISGNIVSASGDAQKSACIVLDNLPVTSHYEIINNFLQLGAGYSALWINSGAETVARNNLIYLQSSTVENRYGIYLQGTKDVEIGCNEIIGDATTMSNKFARGIYLSGADGAQLSCNSMSSNRFGLNAAGMCDGTIMRGNDIQSNWDGLLLGRYPDDATAVIGDQVHQGNRWTASSYGHYGAVHFGNQNTLNLSRFFVDPSTDPDFTTTILADGTWFYSEGDNNNSFVCDEPEEQCPDGIGYQGLTPVWTELDTLLAIGNLGFEKFDTALSWTGRLHVYHRIKAWQSQLTLPDVLEDFLTNNATTNIGKFSNAFDSLSVAFIPTIARADDMNDWQDDIGSDFSSAHVYDSLLFDDPENSGYLSGLAGELVSIYNTTEDYRTTLKASMTRAFACVANTKAILITLSAGRSWETDLRDALKSVIYYLDGSQAPNLSVLTTLAESCPDAQGDGVFIARSRMGELGLGEGYDDYDICSTAEPRSSGKPKTSNQMVLYPNPVRDVLHIETFIPMISVHIYDYSGRQMGNWENTDTSFELSLSHLESGMYVIETLLIDKSRVSEKIVLHQLK